MCALAKPGWNGSQWPQQPCEPSTIYDQTRAHPRLTTDMLAILKVQGMQSGAELRNISNGGAGLFLRTGLAPRLAEPVLLTLIDGTQLPGTVAWQSGKEYGIAFLETGFRAVDHLTHEQMGADYFNSLIRLQRILR
ncbi:MAG: PilZ domain-containing protein [Alphaproteobacteria bacterium]|nr:PilZ domain-containing protein [Alphaproteobacteria bacterium]